MPFCSLTNRQSSMWIIINRHLKVSLLDLLHHRASQGTIDIPYRCVCRHPSPAVTSFRKSMGTGLRCPLWLVKTSALMAKGVISAQISPSLLGGTRPQVTPTPTRLLKKEFLTKLTFPSPTRLVESKLANTWLVRLTVDIEKVDDWAIEFSQASQVEREINLIN